MLNNKISRQHNGYGRKLLGLSVRGFYYFEDDDIQNLIFEAQKRFNNYRQNDKYNRNVHDWVWSHAEVREKIIDIACKMFDPKSTEPSQNLFDKYVFTE